MGDWEIVHNHQCGYVLVCSEAGVNPVWGELRKLSTQHGGGGKGSNAPTK